MNNLNRYPYYVNRPISVSVIQNRTHSNTFSKYKFNSGSIIKINIKKNNKVKDLCNDLYIGNKYKQLIIRNYKPTNNPFYSNSNFRNKLSKNGYSRNKLGTFYCK